MHIVYLGFGREGYVSLRSKTVSWRSINILFWNGRNPVGLGYIVKDLLLLIFIRSRFCFILISYILNKTSKLIFIFYPYIFANFNIKSLFLLRRSSVMICHEREPVDTVISTISHIKPYLTVLQLWLYPVDICHFETETEFNLFYV